MVEPGMFARSAGQTYPSARITIFLYTPLLAETSNKTI